MQAGLGWPGIGATVVVVAGIVVVVVVVVDVEDVDDVVDALVVSGSVVAASAEGAAGSSVVGGSVVAADRGRRVLGRGDARRRRVGVERRPLAGAGAEHHRQPRPDPAPSILFAAVRAPVHGKPWARLDPGTTSSSTFSRSLAILVESLRFGYGRAANGPDRQPLRPGRRHAAAVPRRPGRAPRRLERRHRPRRGRQLVPADRPVGAARGGQDRAVCWPSGTRPARPAGRSSCSRPGPAATCGPRSPRRCRRWSAT